MGYQGEDNDVPVRSPIDLGTAKTASTQDEDDFSTLKQVLQLVEEAEADCGDMNKIDLAHPKLSADQQVLAYQFALNELVLPLKTLITSTINDVELKRREQANGQ